MNRLIDEAPGKPLPISDSLGNIESALRFISNVQPQHDMETDIQARGKQLILDALADALMVVAERADVVRPAGMVAVG